MTNRLIGRICAFLISVARRRVVPSPDILEIAHYSQCPKCRQVIEAQGWRVAFKCDNNGIYEVTFKATDIEECDHLSGECVKDEEEDEEDEAIRPERLAVGEETPKRPKRAEADFYVV